MHVSKTVLTGALLALALSFSAAAGTAAGHPVPWDFAPGTQLNFEGGWLHIDHALVDRCGSVEVLQMDLDIPLGGDIPLTEGDLCGLTLVLDGPVEAWGNGAGGDFDLILSAGSVALNLAAGVDKVQDLGIIELGSVNWVTAASLGLSPSNDVTVDALHALHGALVDEVEDSSTAR